MMRPALIGLAALTAVGGTAVVINQRTAPPPDAPPVIALPPGVEPFIDKKIAPYEIEGATAGDLKSAIAAKGPRKGLASFIAYTEWTVDWQYRFVEQPGACVIDASALGVRATIVQYLPHWKAPVDAPKELTEKWALYRAALNAHEDLHAQYGIDAAREILAMLLKLPPAKTCADIETEADRAGRAIHDKSRARDRALDARTNNGLDGLPAL